MSIFEYDQERHMQQEREAGIQKGEQQLLRRLVKKNLSRGMSISEIAEVLDETEERIREIAAEVAAISGSKQTVLQSKTDAMQSERTIEIHSKKT